MTKMPDKIYASRYEAETGHGEWEDYQPFGEGLSTRYIRGGIVAKMTALHKALLFEFKEKLENECVSDDDISDMLDADFKEIKKIEDLLNE